MNQAMKWHHIGDERLRMKTNHKKKNKNLLSHNNVSDGGNRSGGGGNEITGLVLAVAGFIAVVSLSLINKNRTKGSKSNPKPKPLKNQEDQEIETNQGLQVLLQPSSSTTTIKDTAPCHGTTDTKSIDRTFIQEEKIDNVPNINDITAVAASATSFQEEIVLSDDSNSESGISSHDSRINEDCLASLEVEKVDDDDHVVSEIVEEKDSPSKAIVINSKDKQDFNSKDEGETIERQNEEHLEVNDEDQTILVSNSFQLTTLLMLLPGVILLLVLLLLMLLPQKFSFLQ